MSPFLADRKGLVLAIRRALLERACARIQAFASGMSSGSAWPMRTRRRAFALPLVSVAGGDTSLGYPSFGKA